MLLIVRGFETLPGVVSLVFGLIVSSRGAGSGASPRQQRFRFSHILRDNNAFEAAFQGECREDGPCQHLCFDLHDGTFECGCKDGYTLLSDGYSCIDGYTFLSDGYSCIENSEYELIKHLNLSFPTEHLEYLKKQIFQFISRTDQRSRNGSHENRDPDPRARTLSQSDSSRYSSDSDAGDTFDFSPDLFNQDLLVKQEPDRRHRKRPSTSSSWLQIGSRNEAASTTPLMDTASDLFQPINTVTMTTLPSVPRRHPCENLRCEFGGLCVPNEESGGFRCRCPIGRKGRTCEIAEEIYYPRFQGHSYLSLKVFKETSDYLRIEVEFRPELYEGLLLYFGKANQKNQKFIALVLRNGILEFRYSDGMEIRVLRSDQPVILNSWNRATTYIFAWGIWMQLNGGPRSERRSKEEVLNLASQQFVYLGGFSNLSLLALRVETEVGFQGCVRHLAINSHIYSFRSANQGDVLDGVDVEECSPGVCNTVSCMNGGQCAAVKPNWGACLCPLGFAGDQCDNAVEVIVPSFDGTSHLQFPGLASTSLTFTEILLVFLPHSSDGVLLYNGYHTNGSGDFLSINLVGGYVEMRFDLGSGVTIIRSHSRIELHKWHTVFITRTGRLGSLQVDQQSLVQGLSPGGYTQLSLPLNLYIGGVPILKEIASGAEVTDSFIGCVQKMVINGKPVKLVEQALSGVNIRNCHHPCVQKPCLHGGFCMPTFDTYSCHCPVGYTGIDCEKELVEMVQEPMFIGTSYLHYVNELIIRRLRGQILDLQLTFRSLAPFGLILWAGSREVATFSDYLAVGLHNGYVRLDYNLGSGPVTLLYNSTRVDDGLWHTMEIKRLKEVSTFSDYLVVGLHNEYVRLDYNLGSGPVTLLYNSTRVDDGLWHTMEIKRLKEVSTFSDYLAVGLHNEYVRLDYDLGSGLVTLLSKSTRVDDCLWHSVEIKRFQQRGSVRVDNSQLVIGVSPGPLKELNIKSDLYLGGMSEIGHQNVGTYHNGLVGCLSSFIIDRDFQVELLTMAVTGINIQPCI